MDKQTFYDPELHLFINDKEVSARTGLIRVIQFFKKEGDSPVIVGDRPWEGSALAYPTVLHDPVDGNYKLWYTTHKNLRVCLAVSDAGIEWEKPGLDIENQPDGMTTNIVHPGSIGGGGGFYVDHVPDIAGAWPKGTRFVGCKYLGVNSSEERFEYGIYALWSRDGLHWELHEPAVLPKQGDRFSGNFDPVRGVFIVTSRHHNWEPEASNDVTGLKRDVGLWESRDLIHWKYLGIVLQPDDLDPPDLEFYGMYPFRYANGFLGFIEVYHQSYEKLDTQLAWSEDGLNWQRVGKRDPCLTLGGEGAWDSHWVVPSLNPPEIQGDRMRIWYNGACTKHGSKNAHIRSIGAASIRLDGFVALEAGRSDGALVTTDLPCEKAKKLVVNVSFPTGRFKVEVLDREGRIREGFEAAESRVEGRDGTRLKVRWGEKTAVPPAQNGFAKLRFMLYQGSFFSYRWSDA